ncbi:MAG: hypothetical protein RLY87_2114 [Chloroflexota bacterium]
MTPREPQRLRILVVAPSAPHRGGIAQFSTLLVKTLRQSHEVTFWAIDPLYPAWLFPGNTHTDPSAQRVTCPIDAWVHGWNPFAWLRIWRTVLPTSQDVLVWQWWTPYWVPFLLVLCIQARLRGIPTIALNHQLVEPDAARWQTVIAKGMLRLAGAVIDFGSPSARPGQRVCLPLPIHSEILDKAVVRQDIRARFGIPEDHRVVLCFGFVRPYKGVDIIVRALRNTPSTVQLLIVGEWWHKDHQLRSLCTAEGIGTRVHIVDEYVPNEDVAAYFAAADVVALPYRSGTVSGVATLAAAAGVPLLVSAVGALAGLAAVRDVVHPNTPHAWATALTRLSDAPRAPVAPVPAQPSWQALQRAIEDATVAMQIDTVRVP